MVIQDLLYTDLSSQYDLPHCAQQLGGQFEIQSNENGTSVTARLPVSMPVSR
jgi:signal transduction histidine kinase